MEAETFCYSVDTTSGFGSFYMVFIESLKSFCLCCFFQGFIVLANAIQAPSFRAVEIVCRVPARPKLCVPVCTAPACTSPSLLQLAAILALCVVHNSLSCLLYSNLIFFKDRFHLLSIYALSEPHYIIFSELYGFAKLLHLSTACTQNVFSGSSAKIVYKALVIFTEVSE